MKVKILNKKAQIPSGITWFVAFLIIFFIMFIFVTLSLGVSKVKGVFKEELKEEEMRSDLLTTKQLVSLLNTEVDFEGEKKTAGELIVLMIEPYLEESLTEEGKKQGLEKNLFEQAKKQGKIKNINELHLLQINIDWYEAYNIDKNQLGEKNKEIIEILDKILYSVCKEHQLKIPTHYLLRKKGETKIFVTGICGNGICKDANFDVGGYTNVETKSFYEEFNFNVGIIKLYYNGYVFNIIYGGKC